MSSFVSFLFCVNVSLMPPRSPLNLLPDHEFLVFFNILLFCKDFVFLLKVSRLSIGFSLEVISCINYFVFHHLWGSLGSRARVILVLRECIRNTPAVLLVLPTFDDTSSLGSSPHWVIYLPGSNLGDCLLFPCGEYRGWTKTHHFLFAPTFSVSLSFSLPPPAI